MKADPGQVYEFGEYRLNTRERLLLRHQTPIALTPKAFEILQILVQDSGHLITKQELLQKIWRDVAVEESNLARNIFTLRKALGDDADNSPFIETVPKIGYRFISPVRVLPAEDSAAGPQAAVGGVRTGIPYAALVIAVTAIVLLAGLLITNSRRHSAAAAPGRIMRSTAA